jgi:hypothetical protein
LNEERIRQLNPLTAEIKFTAEDADILDLVLHVQPELRICAEAVRQARQVGLQYPILSADVFLQRLVDRAGRFPGTATDVTAEAINRLFPAEWFPINDEIDLITRTHLAVQRCNQELMESMLERAAAAESED